MADDDWAAFREQPQSDTPPAATPAPAGDEWSSFRTAANPWQQEQGDTALPESFLSRLAHGDIIKDITSGQLSQKLKQYGAENLKVGNYGRVALATIGATLAGIPEMAVSGFTAPHDALTKEMTPEEQVQRSLDMAMTFGLRPSVGRTGPIVRTADGDLIHITQDEAGRPVAENLGQPPTPQTFENAATVAADAAHKNVAADEIAKAATENREPVAPSAPDTSTVRANMEKAWQEQGITPQEMAKAAQTDAMTAHDLSSAAAHPTDLPPLVSPAVQPLSAPGRILDNLRSVRDTAFDVGDWVQKAIAPISTGPDTAIRYVTQYLNSLRRISWDWDRYDRMLKEQLDPAGREAVYRAMDEEVTMARSGDYDPTRGINTLDPREQAIARELSQHAIRTRMDMLDRGMVTDDGLGKWYVPRLFRGIERGQTTGIGPAAHIRERTGTMKQRKYLTAEESEAAAKEMVGQRLAKQLRTNDEIQASVDKVQLVRDIRVLPMVLAKQQKAIAAHDFIEGVRQYGLATGDPQVAFGEMPKEGKWVTIPQSDLYNWEFRQKDDVTYATQAPLHIREEWSGPIQAITDSKFGNFDKFIANVKNRPMSLIMNSPFIHGSVIFSKALPAHPGMMLSFRFLRQGPQLLTDQKFMHDMLDGGMVLWGRRAGFKQDITGSPEAAQLQPGRSFTANLIGAGFDIFSEKAGQTARQAVDKAGEFVHDRMLGEQIQKLQVAIAYDYRETLAKKFPDMPEPVLNTLAAWESNRFAGSLPPEAMSRGARGFLNAMFFSRQFTFGNLGILKDAVKGPPEYVMAPVRDMLGPEGASQAEALKGFARRKAFSVVMLDLAMYYGVNAMLQSAIQVASGTPMSDEAAGYWWRLKQAANRVSEHPLTPTSYLSFLPSLSPTFYHEPGKEGKILPGYRNDGTAIYARSVIGRMGEDYTGLVVSPMAWTLNKMAPLLRAFIDVLSNKDGFDHPVYDPNALRAGDIGQAWNIAKHFIEAELPMQQVQGATNLLTGKGDYKDVINTFGPYMPPPMTITGSQGYPGGPVAGVIAEHQRNQRTAQDLAMGSIKQMVQQQGDIPGARQRMTELGVNKGLQTYLINNWQHPGQSKLSTRAMSEFYQHASPMEKEILNSMVGQR